MTATNHTLTGAAIALVTKKPELAIPLAFLSHFATDAIPHFHASQASAKTKKRIVFTDVVVAPAIIVLLSFVLKSYVAWWIIFLCATASVSPDLVWGWRLFKYKDLDKVTTEPMSQFSRFHEKIQWGSNKPGAAIEIGWFLLMLVLIWLLTR